MIESLRLTDSNFESEVLESGLPVLVDFWGSWCPPCKMMEPVVKNLANELKGKVKVGKLNVDRNPVTRSRFDIAAVPTFMVFRSGNIEARSIGAKSKKQLLSMINDVPGEVRVQQPINEIGTSPPKRLGRIPRSK